MKIINARLDKPQINVKLGNTPRINAGFNNVILTGTAKHDKLINRDLPDQHPITAITGLEEALDNAITGDELIEFTNQEVIALWNMI